MPKRPSYAGRYAAYFNHSTTSDVKVVIEVAQTEDNLARRQLQLQGNACQSENAGELRAHSLVLMGNSPVWKVVISGVVEQAQLERWQGTHKRMTMTMIVEEGEQAASHMLIQCLYTDSLPDIKTEVDLRVILGDQYEVKAVQYEADQYEVKAVLALCAEKLEMLTDLGAISWGLADSVMQLPAGYLENPGLSCLVVKIQEKILKHVAAEPSLPGIGLDLEVVMRNSTLEEGLMALPLHKCASLLSDDRCRVASENTVAAAVVRRLEHEGSRSGEGDEEHVQSPELRAEIMGNVIRVPHLSPLFAAAMPTFASQLISAVGAEIYIVGRELDRVPADLRENLTKNPCIPKCWLSPPRPLSTVTALEFDWEASTAELANKFDSGTKLLARSPTHFFAGMGWSVYVATNPSPDNEGRIVGLFISSQYPLLWKGNFWGARGYVDILAPDKKSSLRRQFDWSGIAIRGWGWADFFQTPPLQSWDQSCMQKCSFDGVVTIRVKVTEVM